jgi:hypothetical protein
MRSSLP